MIETASTFPENDHGPVVARAAVMATQVSRLEGVGPIVVILFCHGCAERAPRIIECGAAEVHRVEKIVTPTTGDEANRLGVDLDDSGDRDNNGGKLMAFLEENIIEPFDLGGAATVRVTSEVTWELSIAHCNDDLVQLSMVGGMVPLSALFDPLGAHDPGWQAIEVSAGRYEQTSSGYIVGFGVRADLAFDAITTPMAAFLDARAPLQPKLYEQFDTDRDRTITLAEVRANSLTKSLLEADLTLGDVKALSFGILVSSAAP